MRDLSLEARAWLEKGMTPITVREACRRGHALNGADAQALEHALTQAEEIADHLRSAFERGIRRAIQTKKRENKT